LLLVIALAYVLVSLLAGWYVIVRLLRQRRRNSTLLENAGDAVVVIGRDGRLIHASASMQKVLGYSVNEIMKMDIASLAHPEDATPLLQVMQKVMSMPGVPVKGHTGRMLHGDGTWHWYEATVTNMLHDKDILGIVDNFRDVTETVVAQQKTKNANRLYGFISQINQAIVQTGSETELYAQTCRVASEFGNFKMVWIGLFNTDRTRVSLSSECGIPVGTLARFTDAEVWYQGPMFQVLETGKSYVCNDIESFHHQGWREFADVHGIGSFMVLPLKKDGEVIGTLNLYSSSAELFNAEECTLLEEVAGDISFALNSFERERSRERAEKRLRASEQRLKQAQSIANVGSFEIDFATGISSWSDELCRIYGFEVSNNRHPYEDWFSMVHPDDIAHVREVATQARQTLQPSAIYHRIIRQDGSLRYIFSQGEFDLDEQGALIGMHGVAHDITQIKESEGERNRSEQNLQLIMDLIPQGIFIKDLQGRYVFVNESFASLYGVSAGEFLSEDSYQQMELEQERNLFLQQDRQVIQSGETLVIPEAIFTGIDGSVRYFYTVKVPYTLAGDSGTGMLGIALDITAQKQADLERTRMIGDLLRRNKELEQFSYVVSHNVRAPLVNIISLISLLDTTGSCEDQEVLVALTESTDKLDSVILDLNFILNMKHELTESMEHVDFLELVDDIKLSIANMIESSGVSITADFSAAGSVHCFKSYLHSIFYNLILNGIKYRRPGIPSVVHVCSRMETGQLMLEFSDNGLGIDLGKFGNDIFGLYKRFHHGTEGKGIGLYMVKVQLEQLKGNISVESEVGVGTVFRIWFQPAEPSLER
jgi:PAS domain S-box-containing protein